MQRNNDILRFLLCLLAVFLVSCSFGDEPALCPYNTRLEYWYAANSSTNELPVYADRLQQYLFDSEGRFLQCDTLTGDKLICWNSNLPPGTYTVVVWGNLETSGAESVAVLSEGVEHLKDLSLTAIQGATPDGMPPGYRGNTCRLYYGCTTFEVGEGTVTARRVYLSHAHAALKVTVQWRAGAPEEEGVYRMRLDGLPAEYGFLKGWEAELPYGEGSYTVPYVNISKQVNHETPAVLNYNNDVTGSFVTFRYTGSSHPTWSLWRDGQPIIRGIDLYRFFHDAKINIDLDHNVAQEFDIVVTVYENKYTVSLAGTSDWYEGGSFYW